MRALLIALLVFAVPPASAGKPKRVAVPKGVKETGRRRSSPAGGRRWWAGSWPARQGPSDLLPVAKHSRDDGIMFPRACLRSFPPVEGLRSCASTKAGCWSA